MIEKILKMLLDGLSPDIRKAVVAFILVLEQKAKETKNPYDDMAVKLLKTLLKI